MLESAPLPEKRRSTLLTVCPFILGAASKPPSRLLLHARCKHARSATQERLAQVFRHCTVPGACSR